MNDYYLEYQSESQTQSDDLPDRLKLMVTGKRSLNRMSRCTRDQHSLPHMITGYGTRSRDLLCCITYQQKYHRTAGTSRDNPSLFEGGQCILHRSTTTRTGCSSLPSKGTVISSRAGEIEQCLHQHCYLTTSTIDPIDLIANSNQRVPITWFYCCLTMVWFCSVIQSNTCTVNTNSQTFTTETVNITKVSNYTFDQQSKACLSWNQHWLCK